MKRTGNKALLGLCAGLLLAIACGQPGPRAEPSEVPAEVGRVFLLGVDGATWRVMDPMIERGELPNIKQLAGMGCRGTMKSDPVSKSPRIWTSVASGVRPEIHGVLDFVRDREAESRQLVNSDDVAVPRLWDIASAAGVEVGVTNYWVTYPVTRVRGFMISDHAIAARSQGRIEFFTGGESPPPVRSALAHPPDLWPVIDPILKPSPFSKAEATDDPLAASFVSLYHTFANDHQALGMALAGLAARGPRLNVLYLGGPDPVSHKFWRYYEPGHAYFKADRPGPLEVAVYGDVIPWVYRYVDAMVGEIRARLEPRDVLLIVSDHGFAASKPGKHGTSGDHDRDGIYVAAGGPVAPPCPGSISLYDVTPTLLYLLDLPVPEYMEGRAATALVDPAFLAAHPVRTTDEMANVERIEGADSLDAVEAERLEQLKALGYLD